MKLNLRKLGLRSFAVIAFSLFAVQASYATIDLYKFDSPEQEQQFKELGQTLRCPKCQNNNIADSSAELAQDMRHKVYEMTKQGKSDDEIISYMIDRYGNFVTYDPPLTVGTLVLWLGPLSVLVFGFGLIVMRSRKTSAEKEAKSEEWDNEHEERLNALLNEDNNDNGKVNK
ncbi:cytochrome c-type biogenesis protein CcmH [Aliivibrio fischeri]|uniref:cytochrome c-type biogenesis protein n=1 Tax=Aliivibrio fischeri TaxID=668 RepID=UPI0012D9EABA|nr:cytochrome c-type biogenesis protein [Aliivibrio fischeri]MUK61050.1 cytochrome c-type biogenesis protein CcmH [Aliivibrio fischeri]MUL20918.1 cytochrome c-type biogenesis protein CcmH [Aliivibrio fischeri]MUL23733.1 cytochrome c-type biogenesis protein CcmH [Aliivibrio fischeri]